MVDQPRRAEAAIPLSIDEQAGELSSGDKVRFPRMAGRSATGDAAVFAACCSANLTDTLVSFKGSAPLQKVVAVVLRLRAPEPGSRSP